MPDNLFVFFPVCFCILLTMGEVINEAAMFSPTLSNLSYKWYHLKDKWIFHTTDNRKTLSYLSHDFITNFNSWNRIDGNKKSAQGYLSHNQNYLPNAVFDNNFTGNIHTYYILILRESLNNFDAQFSTIRCQLATHTIFHFSIWRLEIRENLGIMRYLFKMARAASCH